MRTFHAGVGGLNLLLSMNAAATGVYAIAVVLITYEMSRRIANTGWLQLVVSGLIILGITWFHSTLLEVIIVQQVLRILLLLCGRLSVCQSVGIRRRETS